MKNEEFLELKKILETSYKELEQQKKSEMLSLHDSIAVWAGLKAYETLKAIIDNAEHSEEPPYDALIKFLAEWWDEVKGTCLAYTATSSPLSHLCCEIANYLAKHAPKKSSALSFLMPSIRYTVNLVTDDDLTDIDLKVVIQTHITSEDNESLLPVQQLSNLGLETDEDIIFVNPFVADNKKKLKPLTENEKHRILQHSVSTQELIASKEAYFKQAFDKPSLYTELLSLIKGLYAGGAHGLQGGTEGNAGVAAHNARKKFYEFWEMLSEEKRREACQIKDFEQEVKNKICNPEWKDSCVEVAARAIENIVSHSRDALTAISLDKTQMDKLLAMHESQFNNAKKELLSEKYTGRDPLCLSESQINSFINPDQIKTLEDVLFILQGLQPEEIKTVFTKFKKEIAEVIKQPDDYITLFLNLNPKQIEAFLKEYHDEWINSDYYYSSLIYVINLLSIETVSAVLECSRLDRLDILWEGTAKEKKDLLWDKTLGKFLLRMQAFSSVALTDNFGPYWQLGVPEEKKEECWNKVVHVLVEKVKSIDDLKNISKGIREERYRKDFWMRGVRELIANTTMREFGEKFIINNQSGYEFFKEVWGKIDEKSKPLFFATFVEKIEAGKNDIGWFSDMVALLSQNNDLNFWEKVVDGISFYNLKMMWEMAPEGKKEVIWNKVFEKFFQDISAESSSFYVGRMAGFIWRFFPEEKREEAWNKIISVLVKKVKNIGDIREISDGIRDERYRKDFLKKGVLKLIEMANTTELKFSEKLTIFNQYSADFFKDVWDAVDEDQKPLFFNRHVKRIDVDWQNFDRVLKIKDLLPRNNELHFREKLDGDPFLIDLLEDEDLLSVSRKFLDVWSTTPEEQRENYLSKAVPVLAAKVKTAANFWEILGSIPEEKHKKDFWKRCVIKLIEKTIWNNEEDPNSYIKFSVIFHIPFHYTLIPLDKALMDDVWNEIEGTLSTAIEKALQKTPISETEIQHIWFTVPENKRGEFGRKIVGKFVDRVDSTIFINFLSAIPYDIREDFWSQGMEKVIGIVTENIENPAVLKPILEKIPYNHWGRFAKVLAHNVKDDAHFVQLLADIPEGGKKIIFEKDFHEMLVNASKDDSKFKAAWKGVPGNKKGSVLYWELFKHLSASNFQTIWDAAKADGQHSLEDLVWHVWPKLKTVEDFVAVFKTIKGEGQEEQKKLFKKYADSLSDKLDAKEIKELKDVLSAVQIKYLEKEHDKQDYREFQRLYDEKLNIGFFKNPASKHWKANDNNATMKKVRDYAQQHPTSRTASVLKAMKPRH